MAKFTGIISYDVTIEEQSSQENLDALVGKVFKAINAVNGVAFCEEVDRDIEEEEEDVD